MTIFLQRSGKLLREGSPAAAAVAFEIVSGSAEYTVEGSAAERSALDCVCSDPALRPLLEHVHFDVRAELEVPFRVIDEPVVAIAGRALAVPAVAAAHVHHALQLAMWHRLMPGRRRLEDRVVLTSQRTSMASLGGPRASPTT